jgi:thymidylate synthase (FAD)
MKAELVDCMGTDLTVVNAARVSFNKESHFKYTEMGEHLEDRDVKLIKYLADNKHFTLDNDSNTRSGSAIMK